MANYSLNKKKILNDPVFGFITIPHELVYDVMEHPFFQRLRRIKQLGLTHLVYPGALHTRFHHAIGAMGLMQDTIKVLREKGQEITEEEELAVTIAILLHDAGHGPFSHALEYSIVHQLKHEELSLLFMERINQDFDGKLDLAIKIFKDEYPKRFLHQLVSGQLDVDRLDYLKRDSFFTGVSEGVIGTERIIKMLNVVNDELVIESKSIYSVEKFILARRLMYWQVYLHKTVLSAEQMLVKLLRRARELSSRGIELFVTPQLKFFLEKDIDIEDFHKNSDILKRFSKLDDFDITSAVKVWSEHGDKVLNELAYSLINRHLFRVELQTEPFDDNYLKNLREKWQNLNPGFENAVDYYVFTGTTENNAYDPGLDNIRVLLKQNVLKDITDESEELNISTITQTIHKNYVCYPKYLLK